MYLIRARFSSCFRSHEAAQWTKYTDECCRVVEQQPEYSDAGRLIRLIRLLELAETIDHRQLSMHCNTGPLSTPLLRWFRAELDALHSSTSHSSTLTLPSWSILTTLVGFTLLYHTIEIALYKASLIDDDPSQETAADQELAVLDLLSSCLRSTRAFFDAFLSIPVNMIPHIPYAYWLQFRHGLMILSRLSGYRSKGGHWDQAYVRSTVDYYDVCDRLIAKVNAAKAMCPADGHEQIEAFSLVSQRVQFIRDRQRQADEASAGADLRMSTQFNFPVSLDDTMWLTDMDDLWNVSW